MLGADSILANHSPSSPPYPRSGCSWACDFSSATLHFFLLPKISPCLPTWNLQTDSAAAASQSTPARNHIASRGSVVVSPTHVAAARPKRSPFSRNIQLLLPAACRLEPLHDDATPAPRTSHPPPSLPRPEPSLFLAPSIPSDDTQPQPSESSDSFLVGGELA